MVLCCAIKEASAPILQKYIQEVYLSYPLRVRNPWFRSGSSTKKRGRDRLFFKQQWSEVFKRHIIVSVFDHIVFEVEQGDFLFFVGFVKWQIHTFVSKGAT